MGILAGCKAIYQTNVRVRPRSCPFRGPSAGSGCAEQSTIQRTLDAFTQENVAQLRGALEAIGGRHSRLPSHPYEREMLLLEVDLTGLRASKRAQARPRATSLGRRTPRVAAGEGERPALRGGPLLQAPSRKHRSCGVLKGTINELERVLKSAPQKRARTLVRLDGGFGTDENLGWLCLRGYEFVAKGYHGGRAKKLAKSVAENGLARGAHARAAPGDRSPRRGAPLLAPEQDGREEVDRREGLSPTPTTSSRP